jgi:DNA-directed RNA polymerase specialized sigma24 family protein
VGAAEELVQEVFMKVWVHRERVAEVENFEAWVFIITRNLSFNYLRKIAREDAFHRGLSGREDVAPERARADN